jgi:integrase
MASIKKRETGWRAQIAVLGVRENKTFTTRAEAVSWAARRETEIREDAATGVQRHRTVDDAFRRYEKEVSATKRGHRQEALRLAAIGRTEIDGAALQDMRLMDVTSDVLGKWRDHRLKVDQVKGSSINRDLNLLSHVFSSAVREWKWIAKSPTTDVRRPQDPAPRERLYSDDEIARLCLACGLELGQSDPAATGYQRVAVAFLYAIETAMRAGEICALTAADLVGRSARLRAEVTKNGSRRDVPQSKRALELLGLLPPVPDGRPLFQMTAATLDALFRKARERAGIEGATFHDTRHLAVTRLAKKFPNVLDLARMTGHKDLRKLQIYYNETAEKMADLLD